MNDELTGLHNRQSYLLVGEQALALCRRNRVPALVVVLDIDGLEGVNSEHGTEAGDLVRAAADVARASFRQADVVARLGDDEFAALLVDYNEQPDVALGHIAAAVERRNSAGDLPVPLSLSIGTALYDPSWPVTLEELLEQADEARRESRG